MIGWGVYLFFGIVGGGGALTTKLYLDRNKAGRGHYVWKD